MKRYRKTGGGILGLIDRVKKPIGGVLAVAFIITTYSLASADDYQEAKRRAEPATVTQAEEPAAPALHAGQVGHREVCQHGQLYRQQ